jgi:hypothetical protein
VLAHEVELLRLSGNTLVMDVQHVEANNHFGIVMGNLCLRNGSSEAFVAFCGVWRFHDCLIVEHWENAYDTSALAEMLSTVCLSTRDGYESVKARTS